MESIKQNTEVKAWKFVKWDVKPLSTLRNSKVYLLRAKLNQGQKMSREEKNWLAQAVNTNTYFRTAVPLMGYCFDFIDVLKRYLVNQYGHWSEYYAPRQDQSSGALVRQNKSDSGSITFNHDSYGYDKPRNDTNIVRLFQE